MRSSITLLRLLVVALFVVGASCGPLPCNDNSGCPNDQYCAKATGDCGGAGTCTARPQACTLIYDPVCGCNGQTYGSACAAAAAGMNAGSRGECAKGCVTDKDCPKGQVCEPGKGCKTLPAPPCKSNADCVANTQYCAKATGDCGGTGACTARPMACDKVLDPVCGCDGMTYGNACEAAAAGVNVVAKGACKKTCTVDKDCQAGQVCEQDTGCKNPMICVAGCHVDGDCAMGQVCKQAACLTCPCPGTCEAPPACKSNADCPANTHLCAKKSGDCSGGGQCTQRPQGCNKIYDPVCGCDGKTYGNECDAAVAGVNVAARGECKMTCTSDKECPGGQVCEPDRGCMKPMICVVGCHVDADCGIGKTCTVRMCLTCPCPGACN